MNKPIEELIDQAALSTVLADHVRDYPGLYRGPIEELVKDTIIQCGKFMDPVTRNFMFKHFGVE